MRRVWLGNGEVPRVRAQARARRAIVGAAVLVVLVTALVGCGSGGGDAAPQQVTLAELASQQEAHSGQVVEVAGVVRRFDDGDGRASYVIEDSAQHRVAVSPGARFADRVGTEVVVVGRYTFDESTGRSIDVTAVRPAT